MILLGDIGGTNTRMAVSNGIAFDEPALFLTNQNYTESLRQITETAKTILGEHTATQAVFGIAGTLSPEKDRLLRAPNLSVWKDKPLQADLEKALGVPVSLVNDASLGGLGEATEGAGKGSRIMAYVTVGTGIGGARIVNGRIDETALGFEIGHQYLVLGEEAREAEELASGGALHERFGKHPKEIVDEKVWEELSRVFAYALFNTIVHWSPDRVVLGGSMFNTPGISIPVVEETLKKIGYAFPILPPLTKASLGSIGGLYGAQAYARTRI